MYEVQVKPIFLHNYLGWHPFPMNVHFRPAKMKDEQGHCNWEKHFVGMGVVYVRWWVYYWAMSSAQKCLLGRPLSILSPVKRGHIIFPIRLPSSIAIGMLKTCWFGLQSLCLRKVPKDSLQVTVDLILSLSWWNPKIEFPLESMWIYIHTYIYMSRICNRLVFIW